MKNKITLFLILVSPFAVFSQSEKDDLAQIRNLYAQIQQEKPTYDTTKTAVWDESTEGGEIVRYYKNGELKLVEKKLFGETRKKTTEFYLDEQKLFFSFVRLTIYNRPIYWGKKMAKEVGETEVFDIDKSTIEENRYYFKEQKLFLWIDESKNILKSSDKMFEKKEKSILNQINSILGE